MTKNYKNGKRKNNGKDNGKNNNIIKDIKLKSKRIIITARSDNQKKLLKSIKDNLVTIVYGPAGTGKTKLAVLNGLRDLLNSKFNKIIFTRPCVEANGEELGYLPGDLNEKIHPYMIPIFNFLSEYLSSNQINELIKEEKIITLPLAYQRGITFSNAFVILDESQNTLPSQIRMFLTRIGENCKIVITGDPDQTDIKGVNGLSDAIERLDRIYELGIIEMFEEDVIRHPIVKEIEQRYL